MSFSNTSIFFFFDLLAQFLCSGWRAADPQRMGRRAAHLRLHVPEVLPFPHSNPPLSQPLTHRFPGRAFYEFGPFRLDTGTHRLLKDDTRVSLTPKSFDLLRVLIENQGRAMKKSEILEALWPDTQVEEGNLTFQVSVLRKALGPEARSWIETVPRHGYCWSAPVIVHPVEDGLVRVPAADLLPRRESKSRQTVLQGALLGFGREPGFGSQRSGSRRSRLRWQERASSCPARMARRRRRHVQSL